MEIVWLGGNFIFDVTFAFMTLGVAGTLLYAAIANHEFSVRRWVQGIGVLFVLTVVYFLLFGNYAKIIVDQDLQTKPRVSIEEEIGEVPAIRNLNQTRTYQERLEDSRKAFEENKDLVK